MAATILIVDDEKNIRRTLQMVLTHAGFSTREVGSGEEAFEVLDREEIDLIILDVRLPGMSGIDVLRRLRAEEHLARLPVLMISGHAAVAEAVHAIQLGATDFFEKPLDRDRVLVSVRNALRTLKLERELAALQRDVGQRHEMIGESAAMKKLYSEIEKVAPTKGRVLITGESGTGKELIARAIHQLSPRAGAAFIKVNCAAIPADLIESELFGHERGAFTGAIGRKKGVFELADRGTLFLDEIGDMNPSAQAKVLRALQSGEISRVGSEQVFMVDVRVVAATHRDLEEEVQSGRFREDLYFRLNVVPLRSPSLRERAEDIPALATHFLREFCDENGLKLKAIKPSVLEALSAHAWPGNVRELKNVVERMVILSGEEITSDDLPREFHAGNTPQPPFPPTASRDGMEGQTHEKRMTLREFRDQAERRYILDTLQSLEWNVSRAATLLGIERTNLHKKMRALDIRKTN